MPDLVGMVPMLARFGWNGANAGFGRDGASARFSWDGAPMLSELGIKLGMEFDL